MPTITSYDNLTQFAFLTIQANTGPVTLNVDGVGPKTIKKNHDQDMEDGDFQANQSVIVIYNSVDDTLELTNLAASAAGFTLGTELSTASGVFVTFTDIPSGAKQIDIMFDGVSVGGGTIQIFLGDAGGIETSGYKATGARINGSQTLSLQATTEFLFSNLVAGVPMSGTATLKLENSANNTWTVEGSIQGAAIVFFTAGGKTLSGELTQIEVRNPNGFNGGAVNIQII